MNTRFTSGLFAALALSAAAMDTQIDVTHVRMTQNPTTRKVTIKYDLAVTGGDHAVVRFDILTNSPAGYVSIGRDKFKTVSGDWSVNSLATVTAGTDKTIEWDARADWPDQNSKDAIARVNAYYDNEVVASEWKYCYIDIGTAAEAKTSYPVVCTDVGPETDTANDADIKNHIWFRILPSGEFMMGSPSTAFNYQSKRPHHKVTLTKPFAIGVYSLTKIQYATVAGETSTDLTIKHKLALTNMFGEAWREVSDPVAEDSWIGKLRARSGLAVMLPTEAQWEYAYRAGSTGSFFGTDENFATDDAAAAYYKEAFNVTTYPKTETAHQSPARGYANAWGIHRMVAGGGNWCLDKQSTLSANDAEDPLITSGSGFVLRGNAGLNDGSYKPDDTASFFPGNSGLTATHSGEKTYIRLAIPLQ